MPKKKWERPQLIILVKGKPEEGVLAACKNVGGGASAGLSVVSPCMQRLSVACTDPCFGVASS